MSKIPCIICGSAADPHARAVVGATEELGGRAHLVDAATLGDDSFSWATDGLNQDGFDWRELNGSRGWIRRLAPEEWRSNSTAESHDAIVRQAWISAIVSMVDLAPITWLSDLERIFRLEDKLVQLRTCQRLGVPSPPTVLTNDSLRIPESFGDHLVVKPSAGSYYFEDTGESRVVFATALNRSDPRLEHLSGAPFLVQPRLNAKLHLRVVTVGGRAWAGGLNPENVALDWRSTESAHDSFEVIHRPEILDTALRLAKAFGVGYSSQDWIIDESGEAFFLDLNPAGQWLFLPDEIAAQVTTAIAEWLIDA